MTNALGSTAARSNCLALASLNRSRQRVMLKASIGAMLEKLLAAEVLPVGILDPVQQDVLVAQIVLIVQSNHKPRTDARRALRGRIGRSQRQLNRWSSWFLIFSYRCYYYADCSSSALRPFMSFTMI
jgi:hypothetical protein